MQNIEIKHSRNKYRITWNIGQESYTFETHDKDMIPLWKGATLSHRNLVKETLPSAQFSNDYINLYYPGLIQTMKAIIDEFNRPHTQLARIRKDLEGLRKEEDRVKKEIASVEKAKIKMLESERNKESKIERLEQKRVDLKSKAREKGRREQEMMQDIRDGKIRGIPTKPIAPPLREAKEITYPVRMEFALDHTDNPEQMLNCEKCGAVCLKPEPMPENDKATFLCPLCFRKQINIRNRK